MDTLEVERVQMATLIPHPDNPRRGDVSGIMESLQRFGQVRPILVKQDDIIVAGNHTYEAARRLGWDEINVVRVEMTDDQARAYLIADNRLADKSSYDDEMLVELLERIADETSLRGTGFTQDDVDDLLASIGRVEETVPEEFLGDYAESPEETAARWEGRNEGQRREVVFLLPHEDFDSFRENIQRLKKKYQTESMATAIFEAVRREADA